VSNPGAAVICARCLAATTKGECKRQRGTTPAHQDQSFLVHKSQSICDRNCALRDAYHVK